MPSILPVHQKPKVSSKGDLLPIPIQAIPSATTEAAHLEEIPQDLLEEVSKLSPPNNPVSPPLSTADAPEPASAPSKTNNPIINTVNFDDLQDMGLGFKDPIGGSSVMDDMSQLQLQLQLQTAAEESLLGQPDVKQGVQLSEQSDHPQLQLQLQLRDLIASGLSGPSGQTRTSDGILEEGSSGGSLIK